MDIETIFMEYSKKQFGRKTDPLRILFLTYYFFTHVGRATWTVYDINKALKRMREGMPLALLEAMASGVPVVGSDIAEVNEIILDQQIALLVPPKKPEALATAVSTLLNDENLRRRLGQNARQLMIEKHSWTTIINKMEKVYTEAIQE